MMKLATVDVMGISRVVASTDDTTLFDLARLSEAFQIGPRGFPRDMIDLLGSGALKKPFLKLCESAMAQPEAMLFAYKAGDVTWRAPIERPTKVVCVNSNRPTSRVEQLEPSYGGGWPRAIFFLKAPSSVIGHNQTIEVIADMNSKIQLEGEPAIVIGRRASRVKAADALDYVAGLSLVADISASLFGLQDGVLMNIPGKDGQIEKFINRAMARSKGVDTFCPFGPWIVPLEDIGDPRKIRLQTRVVQPDGTVDPVQEGLIAEQNFSIENIIETVSATTTLEIGDVIAMGAMNVVPGGYLRRADLSQSPGGHVELATTELGTLSNPIRVIAAADLPKPLRVAAE